jgi:hypothetical protein
MSKFIHFQKAMGRDNANVSEENGSLVAQVVALLCTEPKSDALVNPKKVMNFNLVLQLGVALCFCLTSIFLRHFSNVGFQLIVTGLANITFSVGAFYVINKQPDSLSVGACLGSGVVISILSLSTSVYWGELSKCEVVNVDISKYTCDSKVAMRTLCAFSVILFLLQLTFTIYLMKYKTHVLAASQQYSELPGADESDHQDFSEVDAMYHATTKPPQTWAKKEGEKETLIV